MENRGVTNNITDGHIVPESRDSETMSQHAQMQDLEIEADKWNSLFIYFITDTCACVFKCRCEKGSNCVTGEKFYSVPEMYLWSLGWLSWHIYIAIIKLPDPKSYSQDTKMFREYQAWKLLCLQELWDIWVFMTARRGVLNLAGFTEPNTKSDPKSPSHQLSCWLLHFKWLKLGWTHGTFWLSCL